MISDGTEKTPCPDVTAVNVSAVPLFLTVTSAPGTTPPAESTTTPEMDAVDEPWAKAPTPVRQTIEIAASRLTRRCCIGISPVRWPYAAESCRKFTERYALFETQSSPASCARHGGFLGPSSLYVRSEE